MIKQSNKWMSVALLGALAAPVFGQELGGPPRSDGGPRDGERQGPPPRRMEGDRRPDGPGRQDGPGRPEGPNAPRPPMGEAHSPQVRAMMGYLQLVEQYKHLTQDSTAAGVAAVVTAGDVLRPRGPQAAAEYFEKLLPQVKSPSVKNAIRLQLADFYRASGSADKALEQLSALITESPEVAAGPDKKRE